jgi:hypothetical protein
MSCAYDLWKSTDPWWEEGHYDMCEECEEEVCECRCECGECGKKESEFDIYEQGENITLYIQAGTARMTGTLLCPDCIPEE